MRVAESHRRTAVWLSTMTGGRRAALLCWNYVFPMSRSR